MKKPSVLLTLLLLLAGLVAIAAFVRFGGLVPLKGGLSALAWVMLFVLAELSSRSAENRRMLENDEKERLESVGRIQSAVEKLNVKSASLNDSYMDEKQALSQMSASALGLLPSPNLEASKMEYEILTALTRLDFLCDKAIAGTDRAGEFKKELGIISGKLRARERLQLPESQP
ncbi:MAG: hypothetical protein IJU95_05550 [Treponema sp.]|nr:hypothetical protein [Treponema sp.]